MIYREEDQKAKQERRKQMIKYSGGREMELMDGDSGTEGEEPKPLIVNIAGNTRKINR